MNVEKIGSYNETVPYSKIAVVVSKISETVKAVAIPVLLSLGSVYLTLHYAVPLKAFLVTSIAPFNAIGIAMVGLGTLAYLKRLWDAHRSYKKLTVEELELARKEQKIAALQLKVSALDEEKRQYTLAIDALLVKLHIQDGSVYVSRNIEAEGSLKLIQKGYSLSNKCLVAVSWNSENEFYLSNKVLESWNNCRSPYVSKVLACTELDKKQVLVQPWYNSGTLSSNLDKDILKNEQVLLVAEELLLGYTALHKQGLVHGDPKLDNVMLHKENGKFYVKIIDLDIASFATEDSDKKGALVYRSPELLWNEKESIDKQKSEVWSVGLILAMMLAKKVVVIDGIKKMVKNRDESMTVGDYFRKRKINFDGFSRKVACFTQFQLSVEFEYLRPLIDKMLTIDPEERFTMEEALKYFQSCNKSPNLL